MREVEIKQWGVAVRTDAQGHSNGHVRKRTDLGPFYAGTLEYRAQLRAFRSTSAQARARAATYSYTS